MTQQGLYSQSKALYHTELLNTLREGGVGIPVHIQLILSDLCNQDCSFCAYRASNGFSATETFRGGPDGKKNPNRRIPKEKALEILTDAHRWGVKAVQFTGGGEPTVHPDFPEIARHALELGLKCGLVTNGTKVCEEMLEFDWVRVSVDAGDVQTYKRIRKSDAYDRVHDNIQWLGWHKKEKCVLGYGYVITPDNWQGLEVAAMKARSYGAEYIRYSAVFSSEGAAVYDDYFDGIKNRIQYAKKLNDGIDYFKVYDLFGNRISDLKQHAPNYPTCHYQHFTTYIGGNLKVYRCCTTSYQPIGEIGDLNSMSFQQWLFSKERAEKMKRFDARSCKVCQFNGQNRAIDSVVRPQQHVEFV